MQTATTKASVLDKNVLEEAVTLPQKTEKPKIDIVRKEVDDSHYYFVNGEFYPSVTSILDEAAPMAYGLRNFLLTNTPESAQEIKDTTAGFGTRLHDAYQMLLRGATLDLKEQYKTTKEKKHLASFLQWFSDMKPQRRHIEQIVASVKYKYAGTLDFACILDGKLTIVDFKTGSGIYFSHGLQLAAYKQAYEEIYNVKVDQVAILRTGTRHKVGYEFKLIDEPFDSFLNVYNTYLRIHGGKIPEPPMIDVYPDSISLELVDTYMEGGDN